MTCLLDRQEEARGEVGGVGDPHVVRVDQHTVERERLSGWDDV